MACRVIRSLSDEGVQPRDPKVKHTMTLIAYIIGHTNTTLLCPISTVIKLVQSDFNIFDHGISFDSVFFCTTRVVTKRISRLFGVRVEPARNQHNSESYV